MILSALLLAAAVQAAPPPSVSQMRDRIASGQATFHGSESEAMESIRKELLARQACRASGLHYAVNVAPTTGAAMTRLGDLPPANHTLTVLRSFDGCPVSSTVRFNVDRPARR
jgi:hypothetical protein